MRPRDKLVVLSLCSLLLAVLTILLSHVVPDRTYSPAIAGVITGLLLSALVIRYRGGFVELAALGTATSVLGILLSTLLYYIILGMQLQAITGVNILEYITMMVRSGVLLVRFLTDFVMGLAFLLTTAGIIAIVVIGE
jgi:hypothetical protein